MPQKVYPDGTVSGTFDIAGDIASYDEGGISSGLARVGDYDEPIFEPVSKSDSGFIDWLFSPPAAAPAAGSAQKPAPKDSGGGFFDWITDSATNIFAPAVGVAKTAVQGANGTRKSDNRSFLDRVEDTLTAGTRAATILGIGAVVLALVLLFKK